MSTRVFICHSSRSERGRKLGEAVHVRLAEQGHSPRIDLRDVRAGTFWRTEIDGWIERCQVAIVILDDVALRSEWVQYELPILVHKFRQGGQPSLQMVFDGVQAQQVEQVTWVKPLGLTEIQATSTHLGSKPGNVISIDQAAERILTDFGTMTEPTSRTPLLPFGLGSIGGTWAPDEAERKAAWEMYVELITRIAAVELKEEEGLVREALASLYSVFDTTRTILRSYGPGVAADKPGEGGVSFGHIAVSVLNHAIRPMLARWHPRLSHHEALRPEGTSPMQWEREWSDHDACRADLAELQETVRAYAGLLGRISGAEDLLNLT